MWNDMYRDTIFGLKIPYIYETIYLSAPVYLGSSNEIYAHIYVSKKKKKGM